MKKSGSKGSKTKVVGVDTAGNINEAKKLFYQGRKEFREAKKAEDFNSAAQKFSDAISKASEMHEAY